MAMYLITYKLPGREKLLMGPTIPEVHKLFIRDFAEAAGEVKKVIIRKDLDPGFEIKTNYETYRDLFAKPNIGLFTGWRSG